MFCGGYGPSRPLNPFNETQLRLISMVRGFDLALPSSPLALLGYLWVFYALLRLNLSDRGEGSGLRIDECAIMTA